LGKGCLIVDRPTTAFLNSQSFEIMIALDIIFNGQSILHHEISGLLSP
jgi:hypothetical protein